MKEENMATASRHESLWMGTTKLSHYPVLESDQEVDIAIIGGGIAGLASAYSLCKAGKKVSLFEASRIATGTSGYTTAKVTSLHGLRYSFIEKKFGASVARQYGEAHEWALQEMRRIVEEDAIECDFETLPAYTYASIPEEKEKVKEEAEIAMKAGLPASFVDDPKVHLPFKTYGAVKFENQARFHPRKFLLALADNISRHGGKIHEMTRIQEIEEKEGQVLLASESGKKVKAKQVIIATNYPIYDTGLFFARMGQMRSYALAAKVAEPLLTGMYLSASKDERSLRPEKIGDEEWLIIGGGSHPTGSPKGSEKDQYKKIEDFARENFSVKSIEYAWSAQDSTSIDSLPYIGKMPYSENIYVTTGYGEWGMTTGFVSAKILTNLITTGKSAWEEIFSPSRLNIKASVKGASKHILEVVKGFGVYLTKADKIENLKKGEGKIVICKGKKCAVSRNDQGKLCALSPVCTHMGCEVGWNNAEKTWDCPCHGSRFSSEGEVITGPATKPLPKVDVE